MKRYLTSRNGGECESYLRKCVFCLDSLWDIMKKTLKSPNLESAIEDHSPILDIGCGPGSFIAAFLKDHKKRNIFGIDLSNKRLLYGKHLYGRGGKFINGNIESMPFKDESFMFTYANFIYDSVACNFNKYKLAKEIYRILKPGGVHMVNDGEPVIKSAYTSIGFNYIPPRKKGCSEFMTFHKPKVEK